VSGVDGVVGGTSGMLGRFMPPSSGAVAGWRCAAANTVENEGVIEPATAIRHTIAACEKKRLKCVERSGEAFIRIACGRAAWGGGEAAAAEGVVSGGGEVAM